MDIFPVWGWIIIGVMVLGGLNLLNKETGTAVKLDDRIKHLRSYLNFLSTNIYEIKMELEKNKIISSLIEENIREVNRAIGTAMGTLAKAEVELEYHKVARDNASRLAYLNSAIDTVNLVAKSYIQDDKAATVILDNLPRHPAVDAMVDKFRKQKSNIMTNNSDLKHIERIEAAKDK